MNDAETELLEFFMSHCQTARNAQNTPERAAAAAKWELKFQKRLAVIKPQQKKGGK